MRCSSASIFVLHLPPSLPSLVGFTSPGLSRADSNVVVSNENISIHWNSVENATTSVSESNSFSRTSHNFCHFSEIFTNVGQCYLISKVEAVCWSRDRMAKLRFSVFQVSSLIFAIASLLASPKNSFQSDLCLRSSVGRDAYRVQCVNFYQN